MYASDLIFILTGLQPKFSDFDLEAPDLTFQRKLTIERTEVSPCAGQVNYTKCIERG